jgi:hypothetical protein
MWKLWCRSGRQRLRSAERSQWRQSGVSSGTGRRPAEAANQCRAVFRNQPPLRPATKVLFVTGPPIGKTLVSGTRPDTGFWGTRRDELGGTPIGKHWFQAHGPTRDFGAPGPHRKNTGFRHTARHGTREGFRRRTPIGKRWFQAHGPTRDFGAPGGTSQEGLHKGCFRHTARHRILMGRAGTRRDAPSVGRGTALIQSQSPGSRPRGRVVQRSCTRGHPRPSQCTGCPHQRRPAGAGARGPAQKSPSGTHHSQDPECSETQETAPPAHSRPASQKLRNVSCGYGTIANPELGGFSFSCGPAAECDRLDVDPGFPPDCDRLFLGSRLDVELGTRQSATGFSWGTGSMSNPASCGTRVPARLRRLEQSL